MSRLPDHFREATIEEDDVLAGILYNAFLPLWNHNWFQGLYHRLLPIDPSAPLSTLSSIQRARRGFYHSLIKITRIIGGSVFVLCDSPTSSTPTPPPPTTIHAILLWLPPNHRPSPISLLPAYNSGFLRTIFLDYGPSSFHRIILTYESNVDALFAAARIPASACGFVQMLAANPEFKGRGSGKRLLEWAVERHRLSWPGVDVVLDTSTEEGVRSYRKLGFEVVGEKRVDTGTDRCGFWRREGLGEGEREEARNVCVQWVMVKRL